MIRWALTALVILLIVHFTKEHIEKQDGRSNAYWVAYKIQAWVGIAFIGLTIGAIWWP